MKSIIKIARGLLIFFLALPMTMYAQVQSGSGLKLVAGGAVKLVFHETGFINNGELLPGNSTFIFKGNISTSSIAGSQHLSLYNLVIDKAGQELILQNNLQVNGTVTMVNGNLQLNDYQLDLGNTGNIVGEQNLSRITGGNGGTIKATAYLNAPRAANPGNIGVEISSATNLGETTVIRGHNGGFTSDGRMVINRYYDIQPQYNSNLDATVRFHYLDAELNSSENALTVYSSKSRERGWMENGNDKMDAAANWIIKNELDQLHRFTLAAKTNKELAQGIGKTTVELFPNPTPDQFTILLKSVEEKEVAINLYDQLGRWLESKRLKCRAGVNTISWNIARYPAGTYHLYFVNLDLNMVKVVKL